MPAAAVSGRQQQAVRGRDRQAHRVAFAQRRVGVGAREQQRLADAHLGLAGVADDEASDSMCPRTRLPSTTASAACNCRNSGRRQSVAALPTGSARRAAQGAERAEEALQLLARLLAQLGVEVATNFELEMRVYWPLTPVSAAKASMIGLAAVMFA